MIQAAPDLAATDLQQTINTRSAGKILWSCVGYDGNTADAKPVDGTGLKIKGRIVYRSTTAGGSSPEYLGLVEIEVDAGQPVVELDLPAGVEAWFQMSLITIGSSLATHIWVSYDFVRQDY